jgi:hypothetical protein
MTGISRRQETPLVSLRACPRCGAHLDDDCGVFCCAACGYCSLYYPGDFAEVSATGLESELLEGDG